MDPKIKQKWVEALRSGKHTQGKQALRPSANQYCCLGVLCDVLGLEWEYKSTGSYPMGFYIIDVDPVKGRQVSNGCLPDYTATRVGITRKVSEQILVEMNDGDKTFTEIADYIEANL